MNVELRQRVHGKEFRPHEAPGKYAWDAADRPESNSFHISSFIRTRNRVTEEKGGWHCGL